MTKDEKLGVLMERASEQISASVSGWMNGQQFVAQLLMALSDPSLENCSNRSKIEAAIKCASLQLSPSAGHVALIPRNKWKKGRNGYRDKKNGLEEVVCDVMPQWQGFQALMVRSPGVKRVWATLVHVTDEFEWDGTQQKVTHHQYDPFDEKRKFSVINEFRGGYITIEMDDGTKLYHTVSKDRIQKARQCAQTDDIWGKWLREQAMKTLFRDAFARRVIALDPLVSTRLETLTRQEDKVLGNDPSRVVDASAPSRPAITQQTVSPLAASLQARAAQAAEEVEIVAEHVQEPAAEEVVYAEAEEPAVEAEERPDYMGEEDPQPKTSMPRWQEMADEFKQLADDKQRAIYVETAELELSGMNLRKFLKAVGL